MRKSTLGNDFYFSKLILSLDTFTKWAYPTDSEMYESSNARDNSVPPNGQLPPIRNMPEWFKEYLRHVGMIPIPQQLHKLHLQIHKWVKLNQDLWTFLNCARTFKAWE